MDSVATGARAAHRQALLVRCAPLLDQTLAQVDLTRENATLPRGWAVCDGRGSDDALQPQFEGRHGLSMGSCTSMLSVSAEGAGKPSQQERWSC
jgi:hypothetical protein